MNQARRALIRVISTIVLDPCAHIVALGWGITHYRDTILRASGLILDRLFGALGL